MLCTFAWHFFRLDHTVGIVYRCSSVLVALSVAQFSVVNDCSYILCITTQFIDGMLTSDLNLYSSY